MGGMVHAIGSPSGWRFDEPPGAAAAVVPLLCGSAFFA